MCLALPTQIVEIDPERDAAIVTLDGVRKEISLALVEGIEIGDYVLLHVGYAISRIKTEEAEQTLAMVEAMGASESG